MRRLVLAAALTLITAGAGAAQISFTSLEASWVAHVGGNLTYNDPMAPATDTLAQVRWGSEAPGSQAALTEDSGYDFKARASSFTESVGATWELGRFTHFNRPIPAGTAIASVDLHITSSFSVDDGATVRNYDNVDFGFRFLHDETRNASESCPYLSGGSYLEVPGGGDVNANGCADLVTVVPLANNFVSPEGLTLNILGFSDSVANAHSGVLFDSFLSGEHGTNSALLTASFRMADPEQGLDDGPAFDEGLAADTDSTVDIDLLPELEPGPFPPPVPGPGAGFGESPGGVGGPGEDGGPGAGGRPGSAAGIPSEGGLDSDDGLFFESDSSESQIFAPDITLTPAPVPAPGPLTLMALGLLGLGIVRRLGA